MPYSSLAAAPFTRHRGIKMTLAQVNFWAEIYDKALKTYKGNKRKAAATAWSVFDEVFMMEGTGKERRFVRKKR